MEVYEAIVKRRTIRRFRQKPIPEDVLVKIVNAGRLAPSGANLQPCEFIIVDDPDTVAQVFQTVAWAGYIAPAGTPPEGKRPVAYIVSLQNTEVKPVTPTADLAAAIENMILAAMGEGIGSCWIGSVNRKKLAEMLEIPDSHYIDSVLALGYPDESPVVEEENGSIKYWKDPQGVLHVPKRPLRKIVHRNRFGIRTSCAA